MALRRFGSFSSSIWHHHNLFSRLESVIPNASSAATGAPAPNADASTPEVRAAHGERAISDNSSDDDGGAHQAPKRLIPRRSTPAPDLRRQRASCAGSAGHTKMHREPPAKLVVAGGVERVQRG